MDLRTGGIELGWTVDLFNNGPIILLLNYKLPYSARSNPLVFNCIHHVRGVHPLDYKDKGLRNCGKNQNNKKDLLKGFQTVRSCQDGGLRVSKLVVSRNKLNVRVSSIDYKKVSSRKCSLFSSREFLLFYSRECLLFTLNARECLLFSSKECLLFFQGNVYYFLQVSFYYFLKGSFCYFLQGSVIFFLQMLWSAY